MPVLLLWYPAEHRAVIAPEFILPTCPSLHLLNALSSASHLNIIRTILSNTNGNITQRPPSQPFS